MTQVAALFRSMQNRKLKNVVLTGIKRFTLQILLTLVNYLMFRELVTLLASGVSFPLIICVHMGIELFFIPLSVQNTLSVYIGEFISF